MNLFTLKKPVLQPVKDTQYLAVLAGNFMQVIDDSEVKLKTIRLTHDFINAATISREEDDGDFGFLRYCLSK